MTLETTDYSTCVIGRGTCRTLTYITPSGSGRCSGFGAREAYDRADVVVDLTAQPWEKACEFSIAGPMEDPRLADGMTCPVFGTPEPWYETEGERGWRGNCGPLSTVAVDVWLRMAERMGAHISRRGEAEFGYEAYLRRHCADLEEGVGYA